ncbi:MAG: ATP-binding protein [Clostridia bacterium]|nr:ATP-binding protein [Clostridia bacterium]
MERLFFKQLLCRSSRPVLVLDGEHPIYYSESMRQLLEQDRGKDSFRLVSLLAPALETAMREHAAGETQVNLAGQIYSVSVLPYPHEERVYCIVTLQKEPTPLPNREQLVVLRENLKGKLNQYLDQIYGMAELQGMDSEVYQEVSLGVLRIMRLSDHFFRLFGEEETAFHYLVPVDVSAFARSCIEASKKVLPGIPVQFSAEEEKVFARMMPEELEQVFSVLLSNALRFCNQRVTVNVGRKGGKVFLAVIDDGPGLIDPNRMLEWGYTTPDCHGQTGLGISLALAKKLLEHQYADLEYERLGGQTVFRILLEETADPELGRLAEWKVEDQNNHLSRMRIELSDYYKFNKTEEKK